MAQRLKSIGVQESWSLVYRLKRAGLGPPTPSEASLLGLEIVEYESWSPVVRMGDWENL